MFRMVKYCAHTPLRAGWRGGARLGDSMSLHPATRRSARGRGM